MTAPESPEAVRAAVESLDMPTDGLRATPVAGGDTHRAYRVDVPGAERLFVKIDDRTDGGLFGEEAEGLDALRMALSGQDFLSVPRVRSVGPRHLVLPWIQPAAGAPTRLTAARLGAGLAMLHRAQAPSWGWQRDNHLATLPQTNPQLPADAGAATFFVQARLRPLLRLGGTLPAELHRAVEGVCERIHEILPGDDERPRLVHGDLWSGNWIGDHEGRPWLIDPAVHHGCREADVAMTRLFGPFPAAFYDAYIANGPLLPGWKERVDCWNLYPLLAHAQLFGAGWVDRALAAARRYL